MEKKVTRRRLDTKASVAARMQKVWVGLSLRGVNDDIHGAASHAFLRRTRESSSN